MDDWNEDDNPFGDDDSIQIPMQFFSAHAEEWGLNEAVMFYQVVGMIQRGQVRRSQDPSLSDRLEYEVDNLQLSLAFPFWTTKIIAETFESLSEKDVFYSDPFYEGDGYSFEVTGIDVEKRTTPPSATSFGSTPGYVYLLRSQHGLFKIGKAKDPDVRIRTLGVVLPFDIHAEHVIYSPDYTKAERYLHERFRHRRKRGEWFDLTPDDVRFILSLKEL